MLLEAIALALVVALALPAIVRAVRLLRAGPPDFRLDPAANDVAFEPAPITDSPRKVTGQSTKSHIGECSGE